MKLHHRLDLSMRRRTWGGIGHLLGRRPGREAAPEPVGTRVSLDERTRSRLLRIMRQCREAAEGALSVRPLFAEWGAAYRQLDDPGRRELLRQLATEFDPDPAAIAGAFQGYRAAQGADARREAEMRLRLALRSPRLRFVTQLLVPLGMKFVVDLRADLLRYAREEPALAALDQEIEARLSGWFDEGFLELHRITWDSPANLLEKLIRYEAVHEIGSWNDLRHRLDGDRRIYAFFHARMPGEPLIFVEVALTDDLPDNIQRLLDETGQALDSAAARAAIFYSISSTQPGLRGVNFGNSLLKHVITDLRREFPRLGTFATLSPVPGFAAWLAQARGPAAVEAATLRALAEPEWFERTERAALLAPPVLRACAAYLTGARNESGLPLDPVARFHLGNGARLERIHWLADVSRKGLQQSHGIMVNYLYDLRQLDRNAERFATHGRVAAAAAVTRLLKG